MAPDLGADDVAFIARQTVDKAADETPSQILQYATVVGVDLSEGSVPYVTVSPDGPGEGTVVATSLIGGFFFSGMRVAVQYMPPAGLVIIGTVEIATTPYIRASRGCSGGGGG